MDVRWPGPTRQSMLNGEPAHVLMRLQGRVGVGHPVEGIEAGGHVAEVGRDLCVLSIGRAQRRRHAGDDLGVPARPLARVVDRQRQRGAVARREEHLATDAEVAQVVDRVARPDVADDAAALRARERQPPGRLARDRAGDRALGLHEVEAAVRDFEFVVGREAGLARRHVDGASGRVLAEERALRAAQHLDALDVEEVERRRRRPRVEDAVDVQADARLDAVVGEPERRAQPADVDGRVARVGRVELHGRQQFLQAVDVEVARVGDQSAADHRDGNRHLLREFLGSPRRHHDPFAEGRRGQREVEHDGLRQHDVDAARHGFEAVEGGLHTLASGRQADASVLPLFVGEGGGDRPGRLVRDAHGDAWQGRAGAVANHAGQCRGCWLCSQRRRPERDDHDQFQHYPCRHLSPSGRPERRPTCRAAMPPRRPC